MIVHAALHLDTRRRPRCAGTIPGCHRPGRGTQRHTAQWPAHRPPAAEHDDQSTAACGAGNTEPFGFPGSAAHRASERDGDRAGTRRGPGDRAQPLRPPCGRPLLDGAGLPAVTIVPGRHANRRGKRMEITTGTPIGKLDLKDATTYVLEDNGILGVGDILKHLNHERLANFQHWAEARIRNTPCAAERGIRNSFCNGRGGRGGG